jgi:hypothetical protein
MVWLFHPIARILSRIEKKSSPQDGTKTIQLLSMEEICQLDDVFKATEKTDEKKGWIITIDG